MTALQLVSRAAAPSCPAVRFALHRFPLTIKGFPGVKPFQLGDQALPLLLAAMSSRCWTAANSCAYTSSVKLGRA
jgi:hypothetical protein